MRLLLDDPLPNELKTGLAGRQVATVAKRGWSGFKNGALLALAARDFDAFITADQNTHDQQNLAKLPVSVIVLVTPDTRFETVRRLIPRLLAGLNSLQAPSFHRIAP